ncbi:HET-domain-containing protein [Hypoxylon trugodes]|uniref:HET-domain-containing protein n=1 Tax=Hypoxylon trugodes TaxID=326681 RepID=UPI0021A1ED84|nr:HET-domain-containing protein [Hypoxylon trugodes]KAI1391813.1 HET-domain-containing protein [Hypoxylon trugodes]
MLCSVCINFDVRALLLKAEGQTPRRYNTPTTGDAFESLRPAIPHFFKQHPNLLSLRTSAAECDLCNHIWQAYVRISQPIELTDEYLCQGTNASQIFIGTQTWDATLHGLPHLAAIQNGEKGVARILALFEVCALRGRKPSDHPNLLARSIYNNSGSDECLKLAGKLLANCFNKHKSCTSRYPISAELPTRIIDTESANPKLVDGKGRCGTFVALSYCWGGDSDFKLTAASEQSFREGRPLGEFPATLRDAIHVAKALGVRYIWIDALCIIQDSAEDWAQEASRMREVYKGAALTIAAACASKTSEGIFRERSIPPNDSRCWLDWRNGNEIPTKVFLRPGSELWDERMHQSVLNTRSWVLQETLLAPRTLWFGQQQLCFECPKGSVDEAGRTIRITEIYRSKEFMQLLRQEVLPDWKRRLLTYLRERDLRLAIIYPEPSLSNILRARDLWTLLNRSFVWRPFTLQGYFKAPADPMGMSHFGFWVKVIENYSARQLTNQGDTLPALSGLAGEFYTATGDTYVAGLWKLDLIQGLSWTRLPLKKQLPNKFADDKKYLAPSWSWACLPGRKVLFMDLTQYDHVKRFAKLIDMNIQLSTHDPFGAVKGGYITLQGPFLELDSPDLLSDSQPALPFPKLLNWIYRRLKYGGNNEYQQKHKSYPGQKFALLKLIQGRRVMIKTAENLCFLVLESVEGTDSWRRVERLIFTVAENRANEGAELVEALEVLAEFRDALKTNAVKII